MEDLKQLKCPSCGAVLTIDFPGQFVFECPCCHQQVVNTDAYKLAKGDTEPHILEFKLKEEDVIKLFVNEFIEDQSVPTDIFDEIKILSIRKYYVPMYVFEGIIRAPWTVRIERKEKRQRINFRGEIEDCYETIYDYANGEATGNFSYNSMSSKEIAELDLDIVQLQNINVNFASLPIITAVSKIEDTIEVIRPSGNSNSVWWESGEKAANEFGFYEAQRQACSQGNSILTSCSVSCELKKTTFVYIPIWRIDYDYMGLPYSFTSYAEQINSKTGPTSNETKAHPTFDQQTILNRYNINNSYLDKLETYGCVGCIIGDISLIIGVGFSIKWLKSLTFDGFFWKFILIGIAFWIIMQFVKYVYRRIEGIDKIEDDIEEKTKNLQSEADFYRKNSGMRFLEDQLCNINSSPSKEVSSDNIIETNVINEANCNTKSINSSSLTNTKMYCPHCGKLVSIGYKFCSYCGVKL